MDELTAEWQAVDSIRRQSAGPLFRDVRQMFRVQAVRAARRIEDGDFRVPASVEERSVEERQEGSRLVAENILPIQELILEMKGTLSSLSEREQVRLADMLEIDVEDLDDFLRDNDLEAIMRQGVQTAAMRLDANVSFNPNDPAVIAMQQQLNEQAVGIARTTQRFMNDEVRAGITESESVGQIRDRTEGVLRSMSKAEKEAAPTGVPGDRARRIASTTTTTAFETGQQQAFRATNMTGRMWLSQRDGHVRRGHLEADGQARGLEEPFNVRGRLNRPKEELAFPGDPTGRPGNVIQCRCTVLPAPDVETFEKIQQEEPDLSGLPQLSAS